MVEYTLAHVITANVASLGLLLSLNTFDKSMIALTEVNSFCNHTLTLEKEENELRSLL